MDKKASVIIWVLAVVLIFGAAYTFYAKFKPEMALPQAQKEITDQSMGNTSQQAEKESSQASEDNNKDTQKVLAPDFKLKDLSGKEVKLSDYRGKIVILNFWAVWCTYCKQEMPDLDELSKELEKGNDAVILAVDVQEDIKTVKNYLDSNKFSLKVLLDSDGAIAQTYGVSGYPTTFIIDRDGYALTYVPGMTNKETLVNIISKYK